MGVHWALEVLKKNPDISAELIDVQTLLPFDTNGEIVKSLQKTNRLIVLDEDVSGGATGFMMQQILRSYIANYLASIDYMSMPFYANFLILPLQNY